MTKSKNSPVGIVPKLVSMLTPLAAPDRAKAIRAALTLLSDDGTNDDLDLRDSGTGRVGADTGALGGRVPNEQAYFAEKNPRTKGEELAVAARYRELRERATSSSKAEIHTVIRAARKNFDEKNYRRDLENARISGLFTRGTGKDAATLTDYGQKYVNALPDRNAVKEMPRPRKAPRKKGKKKA
jgi:hypothetical protein